MAASPAQPGSCQQHQGASAWVDGAGPAGCCGPNERVSAFYIFLFSEALSRLLPGEMSKGKPIPLHLQPFWQGFKTFPAPG